MTTKPEYARMGGGDGDDDGTRDWRVLLSSNSGFKHPESPPAVSNARPRNGGSFQALSLLRDCFCFVNRRRKKKHVELD